MELDRTWPAGGTPPPSTWAGTAVPARTRTRPHGRRAVGESAARYFPDFFLRAAQYAVIRSDTAFFSSGVI